jgi:tetratricopeptide (TPR) repeat protein
MSRVVKASVAAFVALVALTAVSAAIKAAEPFRPTDPGFVVAELPGGAVRSRDSFARQLLLSRSDPQKAAQLAAALLEEARISAQPQLYGRAESVLAPWVARPTVPATLLTLEADVLQQRHEFVPAVGLLDRAIAQDPRAAHAHLMRANVHIVTGEFDRARPDCGWLLGSGEQWAGSVCLAQVLGSTGQLERARALLERLTAGEAAGPSVDVLAWTLAVRADLDMRAGALAEAQTALTRAVALAPTSDYVRLALADVLIARGCLTDAVSVLGAARPSVGALLRHAIALARAHDSQMEGSLAELRERLAVSAQRGERTHLREEARLALEFANDRRAALALARDNFAVQRETEDVRLLARAASNARDTAALASLEAWIRQTHYEDAVVDQLLQSGRRPS